MVILDLLRLGDYPVTQRFQRTADDRHRRPQLMGNIRDKITAQLLQLFTGLICFQQSFAQSVQRLGQLPDLILLVDIAALRIIMLRHLFSDQPHLIERFGKLPRKKHTQDKHQDHRHDAR